MADSTEFGSRHNQISEDLQGSNDTIPLSPQWLVPKPGENKTGVLTGKIQSPPDHDNCLDIAKSPGKGENLHDSHKKKDVFRPSVLYMESGRAERWRDEERDTNFSARKDRWREGDKELYDNSKADRITDSSGHNYGEARRALGERWTDSGKRDISQDQRSKWNTRWGPDGQETGTQRGKWGDSSKEFDMLLDKGSSHPSYHGKDEKDLDHYRPWRSNTSHNQGRVEPPYHASTPNKQVSPFAHGWGRGENPAPSFSLGRRRISSDTNTYNTQQPVGSISEKVESGLGEDSLLRYSRTKLINVYRITDMRSSLKLLEEADQIPSLILEEPLEPLAFCAPTPEELIILKGIDKGEIMSSGNPQITKEGSVGRVVTDSVQSKGSRLGTRNDLPFAVEDPKSETVGNVKGGSSNYLGSLSYEKHMHSWPNAKVETTQDYQPFAGSKLNPGVDRTFRMNEENFYTREPGPPENSSTLHVGAWRSSSFSEHSKSTVNDWREPSKDVQKDFSNARESSLEDPTNSSREGPKGQVADDSVLRRQPSAVFNKETESCLNLLPSPEDLVLCYKDPQGEIQGPFGGSDIIGWFEAGYFGIELEVRLASAPADSPFYALGDVMPHLRAKARPPPGFSMPKPNEIQDVSGRLNYNSSGKLHSASSMADMMKNEPRYQGPTVDAENRFLESLMSGSMNNAPLEKFAISEGVQGYTGNSSSSLPSDGVGLLAQKMTLERQSSLSNPYSYWPGRDLSSNSAKTDVNDSLLSVPRPNRNLSIPDNAQAQHNPQNVDLMSILHGLPDRYANNVNSGTSGWGNYALPRGLEPHRDVLDKHSGQNVPTQAALGTQQQELQSQNSLLTKLLAQSVSNPSSMLTPENLLSAGLSQDPQSLGLLRQQYLLQSHPQAPVAPQQLPFMDKLLLLKQQEKLEEQEKLVRQQQQLLLQVLSERHPYQGLAESSFVQVQTTGVSAINASLDHSQFQPSSEMFRIDSHIAPAPSLQDESASNHILPSGVSQDHSLNVGSGTSPIHQPRQISGNSVRQRKWDTSLPEQVDNMQQDFLPPKAVMDTLLQSEMANRDPLEQKVDGESIRDASSTQATSIPPGEHIGKSDALQSIGCDSELLAPEKPKGFVVPLTTASLPQDAGENQTNAFLGLKETKNAETQEVKKSSAKKSKKHKASKAQSSESAKGVSNTKKAQSSELEGTNIDNGISDLQSVQGERKTDEVTTDGVDISMHQNSSHVHLIADGGKAMKETSKLGQLVSPFNTEAQTGQRAWKPAPSVKPKSLFEIQQEEQRRAQEEMAFSEISTSLSSMSVSTAWAGIVANSDQKVLSETPQASTNTELTLGTPESSSNQKSQLHDLFCETNMAKSSEGGMQISDAASGLPPVSVAGSQTDLGEDDDFIEAKDVKKNRKKSAKAKGAGVKVSVPVASPDLSVGSNFIDKGNGSHQLQEKEVLPAVPTGPSLGDFVIWKGDSTSPTPAPAWSASSAKLQKPTSLRDIVKEQQKTLSSGSQKTPIPAPQKPVTNQLAHGGGPSWSVSSSSPAKVASSIQNNSSASLSKHKVDDDLFWGPLEQPNHEAKQSDFPQLGSQGSWGSKSTPVKGTPGGSLNRQKSNGGKPVEYSPPTSSQPSSRGKKDALTKKHSEAMEFKEWCESECFRLVGSEDTSFLEFCIKQSRAEAEVLLIENLGTFDPNREFIDKFLNYKDFLPADVIDIAFKTRNDQRATASAVEDMNSDYVGAWGTIQDGANTTDAAPKGGKKKGKKGKKVSPSVLGFNVVSSRILMGEIQSIDD